MGVNGLDLSVIIPVYDTEISVLNRCLDSVCKLSGIEYEVIIVDDGSRDEVAGYCKGYVSKHGNVCRYIAKQNEGVSSARNMGIREAKGEFIIFVDSDDVIISEAYKKIHDEYALEADLILCDTYMIKGSEKVYNRALKECSDKVSPLSVLQEMFLFGKAGFVHGNVYRTSFLKENNLKFNVKCIQCEDSDFNFAVLKSDPQIVYLPQTVYEYYYNAGQAIERWKKDPDGMMYSIEKRYYERRDWVKKMDWPEKEQILNEMQLIRMNAIYADAADLYCAGRLTDKRIKEFERMMGELKCPENAGWLAKMKYNTILSGKWGVLKIYALLRILYLKSLGVY